MKRISTVALATWVLERFTFGCDGEALSGDLLEEFQRGRSVGWCWRQVAIAIGLGVLRVVRDNSFSLVYSASWSTLYPFWRMIGRNHPGYAIPGPAAAFSWPYAAMLDIAGGILPAVSFILLGLAVYLMLDRERLRTSSPIKVLGGMSVGLSVLLTATIGLLYYLKRPVELHAVTDAGFFSILHVWIVSIPLALSVLAAILYASPPAPWLGRRQGSRHRFWAGGSETLRDCLRQSSSSLGRS